MKRLKVYQTVQPAGDTPFGEQVNLYTGELTFRQPDIVLEGAGPTLSLVRDLSSAQTRSLVWRPQVMGDWMLSIPRIETLTDAPLQALPLGSPGKNWVIGPPSDPQRYARCTHLSQPYSTRPVDSVWWHGIELITENGDRQPVLARSAQNTLKPALKVDGQDLPFPAVTQQNWQIGCLPNTSNGELGEAFFAVSPQGIKYWFTHLTGERADTIFEKEPISGLILRQPRMLATLYATRIEDRFGNWLSYQYSGDKLTAITASDGRSVSIQWRQDARLIDRITVQPAAALPRVWRYEYANITPQAAVLSAVVLPDGARWGFALDPALNESFNYQNECTVRTLPNGAPGAVSTVTHPSGLTGRFWTAPTWHARSYVLSACQYPMIGQEIVPYEEVPPLFGTRSLVKKEFSGPGLPVQSWSYSYSAAAGSTTQDACAAMGTCADSAFVDVTDPRGNRTRFVHSNRWGETEGKVLSTEIYQGAQDWLRSEVLTYASSGQGPYPALLGDPMTDWHSNTVKDAVWTPLQKRTIYQQGVTFIWEANSFDQYGNPLGETRSNTLGYVRGSSFTYDNNTYLWVIGQPKSTTCTAPASCAGLVEREIVYDGYVLPRFFYVFGKFQGLRHHGSDGTLTLALDANNNATLFLNWKRGIPQKIQFSDGKVNTAVVDDLGQIDSVTDENGYVTKYGYDVMGRLTTVDYPDGDEVNWANTTRSFVQVQADEFGLPAGHWKQTVSTGNGVQETYFDARWQPVLTREYDAANVTATQRFVGRAFDHAGRETFVAYPLASAPDYPVWNGLIADKKEWAAFAPTPPSLCHPQPDCQPDPPYPGPDPDPDPNPNPNPDPPPPPPFPGLGIHTAYDALGRVVTVQQDSEFGKLTTLSEYLDGLQTRITNPRGFQTTTAYMAYDQPTSDWPRSIVHPEGAYTDIARDAYGKPLSLTRHNQDASQSNVRHYAYDQYQRLCKQSEPETGTTAFGYDEAGNLIWSASGLPWSVNPPCEYTREHAQVVPKRVDRTYDARNRLKTLRHADGLGDQDWSYTPDGLPQQVIAYNGAGLTVPVTTAYAYNKRRLLNGQGEVVSQPNWYAWGIGYGYNANGHLASQSYPTGLVVSYAPNALGQPTAVTSPGQHYATGIGYHPNGAIQQFTYGNGLVHTMTQNLRQLPNTSCDFFGSCDANAALNDHYDYDFNGNVASISDGRTQNRGNRTMAYDGLDRLTNVVSPMFTQASYSYDALDNLTRAKIDGGTGQRDHYYCFDASQRLTNVKVIGCNTGLSVIGLGYDERGNLANKNGQLFKYDIGNRLRDVPGKESYRYDGLGRRVQATKANQSLRLWQYSKSGQLMFGWTRTNPATEATQEYVYLAGSLLATIEHQWPSNTITALRFVHTDSLGSPIAYTDKNPVTATTRWTT